MRLLLDTHILLWWLADDPALSALARALIADPANVVFVSSMALWEIAIKTRLGKMAGDVDEVRAMALASGFAALPFTIEHAVEVARLPDHHRDPFDRALIAQARFEPMRLLTHDAVVAAYGMRQDWEHNWAMARVILRWPLPDVTYAACSTAHTSPHRSTKSRRCSAKDTVSFRCWRQRK